MWTSYKLARQSGSIRRRGGGTAGRLAGDEEEPNAQEPAFLPQAKPWKRANMSKDEFAKLICLVPPEAIKSLKEHADAERLIEAAFGKGLTAEDE